MMNSYDSMKQKLDEIGIYNINAGSNISNELAACAEGLDGLFQSLETMTKEYYIETAEDYGIVRREKFLGKERSEYTTEKRREMLKLLEQNMGGKCTSDAFSDILKSCGLSDFSFTESPTNYRLSIHVNDVLTEEQKDIVRQRVDLEFPLHLSIGVVYSQ